MTLQGIVLQPTQLQESMQRVTALQGRLRELTEDAMGQTWAGS
jgi:hypothetical protein